MAHRAPVKGLRQRKEDRTRAQALLSLPSTQGKLFYSMDYSILRFYRMIWYLVAISGRYGNIQVLEAHLLRKKAQEGNHGLLT